MRCFRYHDWEHYHLYKSSDPSQRFAISSKEKQGASASPEKRLGKYQSQLQAIGVQGDRKKWEKCVRMYVYCIYIYILCISIIVTSILYTHTHNSGRSLDEMGCTH